MSESTKYLIKFGFRNTPHQSKNRWRFFEKDLLLAFPETKSVMCSSSEVNLYQRQLILINLINPVYWFATYVTSADLQQRQGIERKEVHANLDGFIIIARLIGMKRWQGFQERDIN